MTPMSRRGFFGLAAAAPFVAVAAAKEASASYGVSTLKPMLTRGFSTLGMRDWSEYPSPNIIGEAGSKLLSLPRAIDPASNISALPNPFISESAASSLADTLATAAEVVPQPAAAVVLSFPDQSQATTSALGPILAGKIFRNIRAELYDAMCDINDHLARRTLLNLAGCEA